MVSIHCSTLNALKPPPPPPSQLSNLIKPSFLHTKKCPNKRKIARHRTCRAEFSQDAPFAAAIGACMLSSLVLPVSSGGPDDDGDGGSAIDSTDARFAVMGIVSFIPYFNWLSWIFAWLDTGKRQYAVYALVYLAPYLRSNLSLSTEESWLPIASIVFCIIHVQLEASIRNGDLQGFQFFSEAAKHNLSTTRKKGHLSGRQGISEEGRNREDKKLPSSEDQSRNEIGSWGVPKQDHEHLEEDWDDNERRKH